MIATSAPAFWSLSNRTQSQIDQGEHSKCQRFLLLLFVMTWPGRLDVPYILFSHHIKQISIRTDVEVIVLDNGSNHPPATETINSWPYNVRYIFLENADPSPAKALNFGASIARADILCPVIDGARMASPGLLASGLSALKYSERTLAASIGFHLGDDLQQIAVTKGYNQEIEDELLRTIDWPINGYRLFEIAAPGGSSRTAWFGTISESNAPILRKSLLR